ncbi:MAG: ABC transporter permease [Acidimicrobiales bacterium]
MFKLTLRGIAAHKRRLVGTFLAVLFGVAFLTGVSTLTATVNQTFNDLFSNGNKGTGAFVRSTSKIEVDQGPATFTQRGRIDASLVDTIKAVPGVKDAKPFIQGRGRIVNAEGKALGNPDQGPPVFAEAWIDDPALNGWAIADGRAPQSEGDVVIDRKSAKDGQVAVGDKVTVQSLVTIPATVVGIATYAGEDSSGGTTFAAFTVAQAERDVVGEPGKVDGIKIVGDGLAQDELVDRIKPVLPAGIDAITGKALVKELQDDIQKQFLQFFTILLNAFGVVAVIVAVFSIYNTFSIIVAQRTREMALLRAVGARRSQVLRSVLIEALVVGVVASFVGVFAGAGLAIVLKAVLQGAGFGLPATSFVFGPDIVIRGLLIGTVVSVIAGLVPAIKATRIAPLAAMRDAAVESIKVSKPRIIIGSLITALGAYNVLSAGLGSLDDPLPAAGIGTFLLLVGTVVLGPVVARPASRLIGSPLRRFRGVEGRLAQENAMRNPRRTSGSAMALMIGVAIVAFFTIFAASIQSTIDNEIGKSFAADLVVGGGAGPGGGGVTPALATELAKQPNVAAVTGVRFGAVEIEGKPKFLAAGDPSSLGQVLDVGVTSGALTELNATQLAVSKSVAEAHGWTVGTSLPVHFTDGTDATFTVAALFKNANVIGDYLMGLEAWAPHSPDGLDSLVAIKLKDGADLKATKAELEPIVKASAAGTPFHTRQEFIDDQAGQINQFLAFIIVMLAVAIIISLMGIANTLSLSISERTREIGMLRAVGMSRKQLRSTIRWEGSLIALFGTAGGLGLGVVASWAITSATGESGLRYQLPFQSLVLLVVLGAVAGVLAAVLPARRAGRLDVLQAIAHD